MRSVEGGTISVGAIGGGPRSGGISSPSAFGSVMGHAEIGSISNGGGFLPSFSLKETMQYTININNLGNYEVKPLTKVNVKPEVSPLTPPAFNVADVVSEAETILAEAKVQQKVTEANLDHGLKGWIVEAKPRQPKEELGILESKSNYREKVLQSTALMLMVTHGALPFSAEIALLTEANPVVIQSVVSEAAIRPAVLTRLEPAHIQTAASSTEIPEVEEEIEEVVEQKQAKAQLSKKDSGTKDSEQQFIQKRAIVESLEVSKNREHLIEYASNEAEKLAKQLGLKGFTSKLVKKFLVWGEEHISPLVKNTKKDGTIKLADVAIDSDTTEYTSAREAKTKYIDLTKKYKPVEEGEGQPVTIGEVKQVTEGQEAEPLNFSQVAEIVERRLVKKIEQAKGSYTTQTVVEKSSEPTLATLGLADIYQKAA